MEYTIKVLKEDMENSDYMSNEDCAIARAVKRLFPENLHITIGGNFISWNNEKPFTDFPEDIGQKIVDMYDNVIPREDFEFTINL